MIVIKRDIQEIVRGLSEGPDHLANQLCDCLIRNINSLCDYAKEHGVNEAQELPHVAWCHLGGDRPDISGDYLGFGLGHSQLNLGFLGDIVIATLRKRFQEMQDEYISLNPDQVHTLIGDIYIDTEIYVTTEGIFDITHTHSWYVKKLVEKPN